MIYRQQLVVRNSIFYKRSAVLIGYTWGKGMGLLTIFITYALVWTLRVKYIPFLLEDVAVLAAFVYLNHIEPAYAQGDKLTCRLPATPSGLGIKLSFFGISLPLN
ncbi:hypothetical protein VAE122_3040293 [Vibrio aestuarianus]|nr:hypothetical protein VAE122_3040293 [Vibrio aestuarianus]